MGLSVNKRCHTSVIAPHCHSANGRRVYGRCHTSVNSWERTLGILTLVHANKVLHPKRFKRQFEARCSGRRADLGVGQHSQFHQGPPSKPDSHRPGRLWAGARTCVQRLDCKRCLQPLVPLHATAQLRCRLESAR